MRTGTPKAHIISNLAFVRDQMPCGTALVEQIHGIAATLLKHHPEYDERTLRSRDCCALLSRLVGPSHEQKRRERLENRRRACLGLQKNISGAQAYCRILKKRLRDGTLKPFDHGGAGGIHRHRAIVARGMSTYRHLALHQKQVCEKLARQLTKLKASKRMDDLEVATIPPSSAHGHTGTRAHGAHGHTGARAHGHTGTRAHGHPHHTFRKGGV